MKSKIFKSAVCTLVLVLGIQGAAHSQDKTSAKEKEMEAKMEAMEVKLKAMQQKLDSLKTNEAVYPATGTYTYRTPKVMVVPRTPTTPRTYKVAPMPAMPAFTDAFAPSGSFTKAFEGLKTVKFTTGINEEKLQEKIKSGEIKEKTKTYSKSYSISSGDKLQIDNHYGKVTVNTWNKNEFKVDVDIRTLSNEDDDAQKMIDGVTIADSKDAGVVSFTTKIDKMGNSWEISSNNGETKIFRIRKTEVNYTVYIPSKNPLTITNKYGNVILPDFHGKLTINNSYGSLIAKELSNTENAINTRYSEVNIDGLNGGTLNCAYGNMVKIGVANNLNLETSYVSTNIAQVKSAATITSRYGAGLKINNIAKNVKSLTITSSYAPVAVDIKSGSNFEFDVTTRNSLNGFKYTDDNVKVTSKTPADDERYRTNTKNYKGYVGKSNSDTKVTITTSYQPVQFL